VRISNRKIGRLIVQNVNKDSNVIPVERPPAGEAGSDELESVNQLLKDSVSSME